MEYRSKGEIPHTYKSLPEQELTEHQKSVLDEAPTYNQYTSVIITGKLWCHLMNKYKFTKSDDHQYSGIINNVEFNIDVLQKSSSSFVTIGIFTHDSHGPNAPDNQFAKELNLEHQFKKIGLHLMLDPNHGGSIDKSFIDAASLVIFG